MTRFIVANRLSGGGERKAKREGGDRAEKLLAAHADIRLDNKPESEQARRVYSVEAPHADMARMAGELGDDVLVEPEHLRRPAVARPPIVDRVIRAQGVEPLHPGVGAAFEITLRSGNQSVAGAKGLLVLNSLTGRVPGTRQEAVSDAGGKLLFNYDPTQFTPSMIVVEPASSYWSALQVMPRNGSTIEMLGLPKTGPLGWWHHLVGISESSFKRGQGIRIGIADTGLGPNPYVKHVKALGAVVDGKVDPTPKATLDQEGHGTHVAGIIGAIPADGSGDYEGIAAGADIGALRVFGPDGTATQGDIALGVDLLSAEFDADLVNLSLGGPEPSAIERDALMAALELGTLCMASAGNSNGAPVYYPAAYPEAAGVNALGLYGMSPAGTLSAACMPSQPVYFGPGGLFAANFDAVGYEVGCAAPGVGIISTVPARPEVAAPYAEMSGTSMACPAATAALATFLAADTYYTGLPRGPERVARAAQVLAATLRNIGIPNFLAGAGLVTGRAAPTQPGS
ncbi:S8 family serine peptidase [Azospirillum sp.]|uniref:S8 family serine peptidase n=1 Tax=Azospirillum sp. TaxID=34012 RepID=UPI002D34E301|nr:S8 family serine peptidase [Azospirillum sp.]HYD68824.1 S8 family serine peptidase [Azospirillum sp.]